MTIRSGSLNLDSIPAHKRKELMALGERFNQFDVRAQASKGLEGRGPFGTLLEPHGVGPQVWRMIEWAVEEHTRTLDGRVDAQVARKVTSALFHDAMKRGKATRVENLPLVQAAFDTLSFSDDPPTLERLRAVLGKTRSIGWDINELETQLKLMHGVLGLEAVSGAVGEKPTTEARCEIETSLELITKARAEHSVPFGTPEQTAKLNLLDGLLVTLLRQVRRAARAAARKHARPEIAKAFELNKLYSASRRPAASAPEQAPAASA